MSLDVLRSIKTSNGTVLEALILSIENILQNAQGHLGLEGPVKNVTIGLQQLSDFISFSRKEGPEFQMASARDFSMSTGRLYQARV